MFQKLNQSERLEEFQRLHKVTVIPDDIFHSRSRMLIHSTVIMHLLWTGAVQINGNSFKVEQNGESYLIL